MAFDAELTLADHVRGLNSRQGRGRGRGMERLEAHHRRGDTLDEAVILIQDIIEVFNLPDLDDAAAAGKFQAHVHGLQTGEIGTALVDDHPVRHAVLADRPL
jgi:hypothetical protein